MPKLLFCFTLLLFAAAAMAQVSDIITVRRKSGRTIKSFVAGTDMELQTRSGTYLKGPVHSIRNDSLFITVFDIRIVPTYMGVTVVDTVARQVVGLHHKDIGRIKVFRRHRFIRGKMDRLLLYGGAGYLGLNLINSIGSGNQFTERKNLQRLGIALGAAGLGLVIRKYFYVDRYSRRWHRIIYVPLQ